MLSVLDFNLAAIDKFRRTLGLCYGDVRSARNLNETIIRCALVTNGPRLMKKLPALAIVCVAVLAVTACDSSDPLDRPVGVEITDDDPEPQPAVTPEPDEPDTVFPEELSDQDKQTIIAAIVARTATDGASYDFDAMEATFVNNGEAIDITFVYLDPNVIGGSPNVKVSRQSGDIISIIYSRRLSGRVKNNDCNKRSCPIWPGYRAGGGLSVTKLD